MGASLINLQDNLKWVDENKLFKANGEKGKTLIDNIKYVYKLGRILPPLD